MKSDKLIQSLIWRNYRIMLPDQAEEVRQLKEAKSKLPPPLMTDQQLKRLGVLILDALRHGLELCVTYWQDGYYREGVGRCRLSRRRAPSN
ncbi:YolD-like family protein [Halalkalibacter oceani]|uniref:YolD-like family protein n=1 Tax=Halalkalibacter oceani TaxID=1653776 RepID=UPI00339948B2